MAQGLLNRLEREGFVSSARGRRVTRRVLKEELAAGMGWFMLQKGRGARPEGTGRDAKGEAGKKASVQCTHLTPHLLGGGGWVKCVPPPPPPVLPVV